MTQLFLDTETANLTTKNVVQIAAILSSNGKELASINLLIKPDNWTIDPKAQEIHGISLEDCERYGVPIDAALWLFDSLSNQADCIIAHNLQFDEGVIAGEYRRLGRQWLIPGRYCTMKESTNICKIPGPRGYKWPKLIEAHEFFMGCGFDGAHSAMEDTRACLRIYNALQKL